MRWYLLLLLLSCIILNLWNMVNYDDAKSRATNAIVFVIFLVASLWYYFSSGLFE